MTARRPSAALGALVLATVVTLAGCSGGDTPAADDTESAPAASAGQEDPAAQPDADTLLADYGLDGLDAREVIERLDTTALAERPTDLMASIRPNEIILASAEGEVALPMPTDEFYLSIAPYVSQTHECYFHSLTTCVGELQNADLQVTVTDDATGEDIVDTSLTTFDNGFAGVWLPRGIDATLTVEYDGKTATSPVTTKGDDSATCVTTLELA